MACYAENGGKRYIYALETKLTSPFYAGYLYRFDIGANTWENLRTQPPDTSAAGGMVWTGDRYLYIMSYDDFWRYDIVDNTWTTLASHGYGCLSGSSLAWDGGDNIYAAVRATAPSANNDLWVYRISTNTWTSLGPLPAAAASGSSMCRVGGYLYYGVGATNTYWRYSIAENTWTSLAPLPAVVGNWGAAGAQEKVSEEYIYATVGRTTAYFLRYNIQENKWERKADLPATISAHNDRLAFDGTYLYVVRAYGDSGFWRYEVPPIDVDISVSPSYRNGLPGGTLTYTIRVTNFGYDDNFVLTPSDDAGWTLSISPTRLIIPSGQSRTATLSVTIPSGEAYRITDNITVKATSETTGVTIAAKCTAYSATWLMPTMDDAQVLENAPDNNYGWTTYMIVSSSRENLMNRRAFIKFDISQGVPAGYTIENARLYLWCYSVLGKRGMNVQLYAVEDDSWTEATITWNNQPALGSLLDTVAVTEENKWYSWDITSFVLQQRGVDNIVSLCLRAERENLTEPENFSYGFSSREAGAYVRPYLWLILKADLSLATLYSMQLDSALYIPDDYRLVMRFHKYDDSYETENVLWPGGPWPEGATGYKKLENIRRPDGKPINKAKL
ncbi:MAG: DNRLRE domain-containing protein, partial [Hadesarchaea archaeon]|nr:DNRLRE domain-containing protein [Hadesarchaea archaeon]